MNELLGLNEGLPGAADAALRRRYNLTPIELIKRKEALMRRFRPEDKGDLFQQFLALQENPEALFTTTVNLPETPFGRMMG